MQKTMKTKILLTIFLSLLFFLYSILIIMVINTAFQQIDIQRKHKIEKALFSVFQYYISGEENPETIADIRSAVLLDENDTAVFSIKNTPVTDPVKKIYEVDISEYKNYLEPDYSNNTLIVLKKMDRPRPNETPRLPAIDRDKKDRVPPSSDEKKTRIKYIYAEVYADEFLFITQFHMLIQFTALCVLVLLLGVLFYVFFRNIRYRNELQMQKDFIVLGKASATLAHEIKNPLSSVLIQTSILKTKDQKKENLEEINIIEEEAHKIKRLADTTGQLIRDPVGCPEKINITKAFSAILDRKKISIDITQSDVDVFIMFDLVRLNVVLENIINNAIETGSPAKDITIMISVKKKTVLVTVSDRGPGLPEDPEILLAPFFTTKDKGFGIGLALARRYMESSGGVIILKNRHDGPGARVQLVFKKQMTTGKRS